MKRYPQKKENYMLPPKLIVAIAALGALAQGIVCARNRSERRF
jgi:F0F1-type ATP synthase membrane subunit c/vacuolar-type H+-ATPase subunit K